MNKANFLTEREKKIVDRFSSDLKEVLGENLGTLQKVQKVVNSLNDHTVLLLIRTGQ